MQVSSIAATGVARNATQDQAMRHAFEGVAKDFEAVFMAQMIKPMWEGIETDGMFGGGHGENVMRDMLMQEYGKAMVQGGNFGLSDSIIEAMMQMQEVANGGSV